MDEQVRVVLPKVVTKHRNLIIDPLLKITMLMSGADKIARNVIIFIYFRLIRNFVFLQQLATNVAGSQNVVLFLLFAKTSFHWTIVFKCLMHFCLQSIKVFSNLPSAFILFSYQVRKSTALIVQTNLAHAAEILCCWS